MPRPSPFLLLLCGLLTLVAHAASAQSLPQALGGIAVGTPWGEVEASHAMSSIERPLSDRDALASLCGYRAARVVTGDGELIVQADDFVVTAVTEITAITPGSDIVAIADTLLATHGQPAHATMRDVQGNMTLERERVRFVALEYDTPRRVLLTVSGEPLWRVQSRVEFEQARWHLNRMTRCVREREAGTAPAPE